MSTNPHPRFVLKELIKSGMKECEITAALNADGVEVTAPTINRIKKGKIKRTSFDIGNGLVRLKERRAVPDHAP